MPSGPYCNIRFTFLSVLCLLTWIKNTRAMAPKWPIHSVENLPAFTCKTFSNRVLVIGNTVSQSPSGLLGFCSSPVTTTHDRSTRSLHWRTQSTSPGFMEAATRSLVFVEHQGVGHLSSAQYSNCTHNIVLDYLLNSRVGLILTCRRVGA